MGKVISINSRKFLGNYYAQSSNSIPDEVAFFAGIIMSQVLPELVCSVYGGLVLLVAFTCTAFTGTIGGLVMYYKSPFRIISCVSTRTVQQAPPSKNRTLEKAA
jgi:hypothetical protein